MITLLGAGIFAIMFLVTLGIISSVSPTTQVAMQNQIYLSQCPFPLQNQLLNVTAPLPAAIVNNQVVYTALPPNVSSFKNITGTGTFFHCYLDYVPTVPPSSNHQALPALTTFPANYGATQFAGFPSGWFAYIGDVFAVLFHKLEAVMVLLGMFIAPTSFNIAGFTINNLTGLPLAIVIALYGLCYIVIGTMIYKTISPFTGSA